MAAARDLPVIDLRATLLDPTDLRGIPAIENGRATWCPPDFLPRPGDPAGVLFLDELSAAPPLIQASLYQLVLDRRVGEYVLPEGWWIVAAGNRQQDRAVTFRMSSALANRFAHFTLEADVDDWRDWAIRNGVDPMIVSFIGLRPALLAEAPGESPAYATPRSWEMLSDVIRSFGGVRKCGDLVHGIVGEGAGREFLAFSRKTALFKRVEAIVEDPENAELPAELDGLYVLTSWIAHGASRPQGVQAGVKLLARLPAEFAVILARDLLSARPSIARQPEYRAFVKRNASLLSG